MAFHNKQLYAILRDGVLIWSRRCLSYWFFFVAHALPLGDAREWYQVNPTFQNQWNLLNLLLFFFRRTHRGKYLIFCEIHTRCSFCAGLWSVWYSSAYVVEKFEMQNCQKYESNVTSILKLFYSTVPSHWTRIKIYVNSSMNISDEILMIFLGESIFGIIGHSNFKGFCCSYIYNSLA